VVYAIRPDNAGGLWLSTNNGLSRFDPEHETFANFDVRHELQANEFNSGASHRSARGELSSAASTDTTPSTPSVCLQGKPKAHPAVLHSSRAGIVAALRWPASGKGLVEHWPRPSLRRVRLPLAVRQP
jgi:hypothetical protein